MNMEQEMYWYGIVGPCIIGTLKIVGGSGIISPEQNIGHAGILVKHISDNLKIPDNKYKITKLLIIKTILNKLILFQHINIICRTRCSKCYNIQYNCIRFFTK